MLVSRGAARARLRARVHTRVVCDTLLAASYIVLVQDVIMRILVTRSLCICASRKSPTVVGAFDDPGYSGSEVQFVYEWRPQRLLVY